MDAFDHAAANARPDCPKCGGTGSYQFTTHGTPKFKICGLCCKHDQGWWQLGDVHSEPGKWCCKAGCGYVSPADPPEDERWHHTDAGWVKGERRTMTLEEQAAMNKALRKSVEIVAKGKRN